MAVQTYSAFVTAQAVTKRTGRRCDAKRVRQWAREHLTRFQDDHYTSHAYSARERDTIVNALVARSRPDAKGTNGRASSASRGRTGTTKAAKATKAAPRVTVTKAAPQRAPDVGTGDPK